MSLPLDRQSIKAALTQAGIGSGDMVLVHSALLSLGLPQEPLTDLNEYYVKVLQEVVGPSGTLIFPAFSYSFCKGQGFDPHSTPSTVSGLANYCLKHKLGYRTADPLFSYIVWGPAAINLPPMSNVCFDSHDSMYEFLVIHHAKYLMLGSGFFFTIWHAEEDRLHTPNRFYKGFSGSFRDHESVEQRTAYFYCRYNTEHTMRDHAKLDAFIEEQIKKGICQRVPVGKSSILGCEVAAMCAAYREVLQRNPWELLQGPALTRAQMEAQIPDNYHTQVERRLYPAIKLAV